MQIDLTGKTALVTGSTAIGGIGYTTAAGLRAAGATVVINGRTADRLQQAVDALGADDQVTGVAADVSTAAGCEALIGAVPQVDILVNNAGGVTPQPVMEIPDSEWESQFAFNVMSGLRLSRHYLPEMAKSGLTPGLSHNRHYGAGRRRSRSNSRLSTSRSHGAQVLTDWCPTPGDAPRVGTLEA